MSLVNIAAATLIALVASYVTVHVISKLKGPDRIMTLDVHKPTPVRVPKIGGLCLITSSIAVLLYLTISCKDNPVLFMRYFQIYLPSIIIGILGLLDDIIGISPIVRVAVSLIVALSVALLFDVSSSITLVGIIHSRLIAELLAVLSILIFSNAVNMLDVMNGIVPISTCIVLVSLIVCLLLRGKSYLSLALLPLVAQYIPLVMYNKYPARVLNGNVGSYFTGTLLGVIACTFGLYLESVIACMPYIVNGLLILASTRGKVLASGRHGVDRPIKCISGRLTPNLNPGAAISLVRLVVLAGADSEYSVVIKITQLFLASSLLAVMISCLGSLVY